MVLGGHYPVYLAQMAFSGARWGMPSFGDERQYFAYLGSLPFYQSQQIVNSCAC